MRKFINLIYLALLLIFILPGCQKIEIPENSNDFQGSLILGKPDNNSITASIMTEEEYQVYLSYGENSKEYKSQTDIKTTGNKAPVSLVMEGLEKNKTYYYIICFKKQGEAEFSKSEEYSFATPKTTGNSFNFAIQSDSHLLNKADKDLYSQSMNNIAALKPDFLFDLGDTFLLDNGDNQNNTLTQDKVDEIYKEQLPFFDIVTRKAPLFFTIGNHESEYGKLLDGSKSNLAAMGTIARTTFVPNPVPNDFYSGNSQEDPQFGLLENYYAFTWGDALFVTLDPYRYGSNGSESDGKGDGWGWTLGKTQYDWLKATLEGSNAKYKFVFSHHAIGNIRGGAKIANLYEWGGYDQSGKYLFDEKRPGWEKPVQQLMKDTGVTIFFQGHDHLFATEIVDGVVYQTLPKPAEMVADKQNNFSYYQGDVLLNSGFLNIGVSDDGIQVDYNRNYLVASGSQTTGVVYSYLVDENHKLTILKSTKDDLTAYGKNEVLVEKGSKIKTNNKKESKDSTNADFVGIGAMAAESMVPVPNGGFSFVIEADPHFDENSSMELLAKTAANIIETIPSFLIDLGDTSMLEKLGKSQAEAENRNKIVAEYFNKFDNIPIKKVTGNHDVGINNQQGNYYSFNQGDALFIVLDPYAYTTQSVSKGGGWSSSLGKVQYDWLKDTLASSQAKYKFVFIHNLVGGIGKDGRGGAEAAELYEWGGSGDSGINEFASRRAGWDLAIHDLLVKYGVDVVFHGHDHFYAMENKDGVTYQLVPQAGTDGNSVNDALSYGYKEGVFLPSPGFLRVVVGDEKAVVEYIHVEADGSYEIPHAYNIVP